MLIFADGIGTGNLDLAERSQRFIEPREKIPYRAKKSQRPIARLHTLVISHLCKMSDALHFFFEFVGGGGHLHSSLVGGRAEAEFRRPQSNDPVSPLRTGSSGRIIVARSVRNRIGVTSFFSRTGCWPACPGLAPFCRPKEWPAAGSCPPSVSCFPCCLFEPSTWRCSRLKPERIALAARLMIRLRLYRDGVERNGGYTLSSFAQTGRLPAHGAIDAGWRNLIVTPDVSLHAQRARHASAPATRRAARAAGERSAAVQGSGGAAAAGSAGRQANARSGAAGCGPATFLRRAAAKVAASMGWSASISASICRTALLAVSINARCAGPMAACRRCGLHGSHRPCLQRTNGAS